MIPDTNRSPGFCRHPQGGFSLLELVIAMALTLVVIGGSVVLFHRSGKVARAQTHVAVSQQSLRAAQRQVVRMLRMAGRGGLPVAALPDGLALSIRDNVPATGELQRIAVGDADSPEILPGTDVLTVRGVFSSPIYQIRPGAGDFGLDSEVAPASGTVWIRDPHPSTGVRQDLQAIRDAVERDEHAALLLVSALDQWAVVEVDRESSVLDQSDRVMLSFTIGTVGGSGHGDAYIGLSGGFPAGLRRVAHAALLEEWRFFVSREYAVEGDSTSELIARLSQLRFFPNTELAHPDNPNLVADIADNIVDLQVALGLDVDGDGVLAEEEPGGDCAGDDWLFNCSEDRAEDGELADPQRWADALGRGALRYARVSTVARVDRAERGFGAPELGRLENRGYGVDPHDPDTLTERRYRRRSMTTVVDLRNL